MSARKALSVLFILLSSVCGAQTETPAVETGGKSLYAALFGGLFVNAVFHGSSRLFGADFAQTSWESVQTNLHSPWVWDNDVFLFNHPGHPYQGGLYHAAARAGGFTFYESLFFDALGSLTWELLGETDIPALNDLIVTTAGGAVFGEMAHLLYLEAASPWAAVPVSPMSAVTNAALKRTPRRTRNLYRFSAGAGAGWLRSSKEIQPRFKKLSEANPTSMFPVYLGFDVVYNNPFTHASTTPYSQFEIMALLGGSFWPPWMDWTILTDGYLLSFNPVYTEKNELSTGLSLHYDLIAGGNMNFSSQALDWTVKWRRLFANTALEVKTHAGWTFFSSSQYYPADDRSSSLDSRDAGNDYGTGGNLKGTITVRHKKRGTLSIGIFNYLFYIIPYNKPDSGGFDSLHLSYLEYSWRFNERLSLALNNSFYIKLTHPRYYTGVVEMANRVMVHVNWTVYARDR
ncbi:MAG: DUF3943 domain-containing protein [Treponema sp.]|jgi:hypothetical protein|nr:DUF3943 domain-containing protein [Treponema sp.]